MEIYAKILGFMAIILVGYAAKRLGLVREQAIGWLSALVLNVTLPCTVLRGLNGVVLDPAYFALLAMGFVLNFFCLGLGRLAAGPSPLPLRGFCMSPRRRSRFRNESRPGIQPVLNITQSIFQSLTPPMPGSKPRISCTASKIRISRASFSASSVFFL